MRAFFSYLTPQLTKSIVQSVRWSTDAYLNYLANDNKVIVDYTSPALCTPVTPFPPIGDAAYRQHAERGSSHGHKKHAQKLLKITCVVPEISTRTDRHTDRHLYMLNAVRCPLRNVRNVRSSVTLGVASSIANDVIVRMTS